MQSIRDVNFVKLKALKKDQLTKFCDSFGIQTRSDAAEMIKEALLFFDNGALSTSQINSYIKNLYSQIRTDEILATGASHEAIVGELQNVDSHIWGMVQGKVDNYVQSNYVRKYFRYNDLVGAVRSTLYLAIESYALCTWYNHWSTVFIEDLICLNDNVVPIIKKTKGVDVIWNEQAIDIKVTNLPKEWSDDGKTIDDAVNDPTSACECLYRNQGAQRFGSENRLYIITHNRQNPSESWKIKRNYQLLKTKINGFFSQQTVLDPVNFSFDSKPYQAYAKILFIIE